MIRDLRLLPRRFETRKEWTTRLRQWEEVSGWRVTTRIGVGVGDRIEERFEMGLG